MNQESGRHGGRTTGRRTLWTVAVALVLCLSFTAPAVSVGVASGTGHDDARAGGGSVESLDDHGRIETDARSISYGTTVRSAVDVDDPTVLESPLLEDGRGGTWYYEALTFEGTADEVVSANLSARGTGTVLALRNPDGETVAVGTNTREDGSTRLVARLASDGAYTLRVLGRNPMMTFRYRLSLSRVDHVESDPGDVDVGEAVVGEISDADSHVDRFRGYHDNITLSVRRGQRVRLRLDAPSAPNLWLYSPNGTLLDQDTWSWEQPADFTTTLPYGGDYRLVVSGSHRSTPFPYRLSASPVRTETVTIPEERREEREYAEFEVRRATLNTTTRYAGMPFELRAAVRNTGTIEGDFEGYVLAGRTQLAWVDESIGFSRSEVITASVRIHQPGYYPVFLGAEYVGQVRVLQRPEPTLSVSTHDGTTRAVINYSRVGSVFDIPLAAVAGTGSDFSRLRVRFDRATRQVIVRARERTVRSGDARLGEQHSPLPRGARPIRVLGLTRQFPGSVSGVANATLSFRIAGSALERGAADVVLYRARDDGTGWTVVTPRLVSATESSYRFRAPVTGSNVVVLAERTPVFEVDNVSTSTEAVAAGSVVSVTAEVANRGLATGTGEVTLRFDDRQVTTRAVTLAPNGTMSVRFQQTFNDSGTHQVTVGNQSTAIEVLAVRQRATTTPTPSPDPVTTAAPAMERTSVRPRSATPDADGRDAAAPLGAIPLVPLLLVVVSLIGGFALVLIGLSGQE